MGKKKKQTRKTKKQEPVATDSGLHDRIMRAVDLIKVGMKSGSKRPLADAISVLRGSAPTEPFRSEGAAEDAAEDVREDT